MVFITLVDFLEDPKTKHKESGMEGTERNHKYKEQFLGSKKAE